jgi:triphosphatase
MTEGDLLPLSPQLVGDCTLRLHLDPRLRSRLWRLAPLRALAAKPKGGRPHAEVWLADRALPFPLTLVRFTPGAAPDGGVPLGGMIGKRRAIAFGETGDLEAALIEGEFVLGPERGRVVALEVRASFSLLPRLLDLGLSLPLVPPPGMGWGEKVREAAAAACEDAKREVEGLGTFAAQAFACRAGALAAALSGLLALHDMADPEPVHEARVAIRRFRALLSAFSPLFREDPALASGHQALKAISRTLARLFARARDFDVFAHGLLAEARRLFPEEDGLADLAALVGAIRAEAYEEIKARAGEEVARLLFALEATGKALGARAEALGEDPLAFAAARLAKRAAPVFGTPPPAALSAEARHRLRLAVKRLRYTAEMFAPLFPDGKTRRLLRRLGRLQDWLGHANDARTAIRLLEICEEEAARRGLTVEAKAKGIILGLAAALEPGAIAEAERLFAKLLRRTPFWELKKE